LVALHCFSRLHPEEIVRLQWEDVSADYSVLDDTRRFTVRAQRNGRNLWLPLIPPASEAITSPTTSVAWQSHPPYGLLFARRNGDGRPLRYGAARNVLREACQQAGLPVVEAIDLRAAFAHGLRMRGLSDHEVTAVLGLTQVRSLDRLPRRHMALDAQRKVREILDL
jgi:integrase